MNLNLNDKHILITGGSKGIGLACALAFLQEGARVTLVARQADTLAAASAKLLQAVPGASVHTVSADLMDAARAAEALAQAQSLGGAVDVLVNSAGAAKRTPAPDLTPQSWHDAMQSKFFSYVHMMDPTIKAMAARGRAPSSTWWATAARWPAPCTCPAARPTQRCCWPAQAWPPPMPSRAYVVGASLLAIRAGQRASPQANNRRQASSHRGEKP
jgi:NAD(P)-dependent dehydrogenase (short-subunit alcohol dehydrogenase family)